MAEYLIQDTTLTNIANAIRNKTGKTGTIAVSSMASAISSISSSSGTARTVETGSFDVRSDLVTNYKLTCSFLPSLLIIHAYQKVDGKQGTLYVADSTGVITWLVYDGACWYTSENTGDGTETYTSTNLMTITHSNNTVTLRPNNDFILGEGLYYRWIAIK